LNFQIKIKLADISIDELISLLDVDVDVDTIKTEWFLEALSVPRGEVKDIKILLIQRPNQYLISQYPLLLRAYENTQYRQRVIVKLCEIITFNISEIRE
jgi:hypothetical protein